MFKRVEGFVAACVLLVGLQLVPRQSHADCESTAGHCDLGDCDSTECGILCPTTGDRIVFGAVWTCSGGWSCRGVGVVLFTSGGT